MFRLSDKVGGDDVGVGGVVGDDGNFGGAGEQVDADPPEQQALGLGDEAVARADQDIRRMAAEQSEGHGRDALHAAQRQDRIGAAKVGGIEDRRRHALAFLRDRAGDHIIDAGHLGRGDAHDGRSHMGIAPAGDVAARRVYRDHLLTGEQAGRQLGLEFGQAGALRLGELAYAFMGELQIVAQPLRHLLGRRRDLVARNHDVAGPAVQA